MFITRDKETGNYIDEFRTRTEAEKAIEAYEAEDKADDTYTEDFYEIVESPYQRVFVYEASDTRPDAVYTAYSFDKEDAIAEAKNFKSAKEAGEVRITAYAIELPDDANYDDAEKLVLDLHNGDVESPQWNPDWGFEDTCVAEEEIF